MRWRVRAQVEWPSTENWVRLQSDALARAGQALNRGASEVGIATLSEADPALPPVRLTAGRWLQPRSRYELVLPVHTGALSATAAIDRASAVEIRARLRSEGRGVATVRTGPLARPLSVRSTSAWRHLAWKGELDLNVRRVVDADVRLRWCRAHIRVTRNPGADTDTLDLDLSVTGRGIWRPAGALLSTLMGRIDAFDLEPMWRDVCARISLVAEQPSLAALEAYDRERPVRERAAVQAGLDTIAARLTEVDAQLATLPRLVRTRKRWLRTWSQLPPANWPTATFRFQAWDDVEARIAEALAATPARERAELLADRLAQQLSWWEADQASSAVAEAADPAPEWNRLTDADLDLSFLASPLTLQRWIRAGDSEPTG